MKTSYLSPTAWLSEILHRGRDLVTASELIPGFSLACSKRSDSGERSESGAKCPDPGVASHDQKPDRGDVSGIKSLPLARTAPPYGIYIDRCIISRFNHIFYVWFYWTVDWYGMILLNFCHRGIMTSTLENCFKGSLENGSTYLRVVRSWNRDLR